MHSTKPSSIILASVENLETIEGAETNNEDKKGPKAKNLQKMTSEGGELQPSAGQTTPAPTPAPSWSRASVVPTVKFCLVYAAPLLLCLVFAAAGSTDMPWRCVYVALLMGKN